ncbi:MAG: hypothetical protein ACO3B1_05465, partial [Candidatus Nanopelagicaceae bacterium]
YKYFLKCIDKMDGNSFRNLIEAYSEVYTQVDENLLGSLDKTARDTAGKVGGVLGREKAGKMPGANVPILGDVIKNEGERRGRAQGQGMYDKAKETLGGLLKQDYEQEGDLVDEAAKRMPKKVRGAKDSKKEMAGRSDAGKRISGDENTGPNYYTKGRSRGAEVDAPTQPGQKPKGTPKLASWEKDDIQYRKANLKAGKVHKVGGERGLPESADLFDTILEYLVAEGYADTNKAAIAIMANMSEEWRQSIIEQSNTLVTPEQRRADEEKYGMNRTTPVPSKPTSASKKARRMPL